MQEFLWLSSRILNASTPYVSSHFTYTFNKILSTGIFPDRLKFLEAKPLCRVSQEKRAKLQEGVPYIKVHRYKPKHLYPKLNGYGDNGQKRLKL